MWAEGELYRKKHCLTEYPKHEYGIYSVADQNNLEASNTVDNVNSKVRPDNVSRILQKVTLLS